MLISSILLLMFCTVFGSIQGSIDAAEKRRVRVAFFPMDGYHITNQDGTYSGMDVEYLEELCEYTDWNVEYVPCDSWEDALQMVSDQEVDLVGSAQFSIERAQKYQYAELSNGYTFGVIAVNPDSGIAYEDFAAMRDITFGMVKDYVRKEEFFQYLEGHHIKNPTVKEYESTQMLQKALEEGEVDAMVHTFTEVRTGQRLIGRFAPRPFYYITYPGNDDLMQELNQAEADLKMSRPELESELMNKYYYSRFDKTALLTTAENDCLAEKQKLIVGYLDGFYPFSYEENGEFKGLTRDLLESGLRVTGVEIEYRRLENRQDARNSLANGQIDILAYCTDEKDTLDEYGIRTVCDYADAPLVLVTEKNQRMKEVNVVATVSFLMDRVESALQMDGVQIVTYDTQKECIEAVKEGSVDAVLCDGYLAEYLMRTEFRYGELQIKNVFSSEYSISMAIRKEDEILGSVLGKTISTIDSKMINEYMLRENKYPLVSVFDFVRSNSLWIISVLVVVIILIIFLAVHMVNDSRKIQKLMYKDISMDIWNLNYLIFRGEHQLLPERRQQYAIVYVNLAQFRRFNIIYGWDAGEHLLKGVANVLLKNVDEKTEICARNQGDRFVVLMTYSNQDAFMERIQDVKGQVEEWIMKETDNRMLLQMGIYFIPETDSDMHLAISYANQALEFAGNHKGDEIKIYDDTLEGLIKERHEREKLLESVDPNKDFVTYYQPKVDIRDGRIVGAEALVRFCDPSDGGRIKAPGFFVPYYEQTGKITEIDFFVYESVCKMLRRRLDAGLPVVTVSCNFSRMHFIKPGFPARFIEVIERYHIEKELIEVEITETLVVEELQSHMVKKTLDVLKEMGIHLSIDDFGAGYSSLGVFEQIPASVIKLDRSFLLNQKDRNRQVKIMRGIVKLSEELEAQIVCEGVETENDISLMREIGAYVAQGYFYSQPVPEAEFEQKLENGIE